MCILDRGLHWPVKDKIILRACCGICPPQVGWSRLGKQLKMIYWLLVAWMLWFSSGLLFSGDLNLAQYFTYARNFSCCCSFTDPQCYFFPQHSNLLHRCCHLHVSSASGELLWERNDPSWYFFRNTGDIYNCKCQGKFRMVGAYIIFWWTHKHMDFFFFFFFSNPYQQLYIHSPRLWNFLETCFFWFPVLQ